MLTTSEIGVSLTIDDNHNLQLIIDDLKKYGTVSVDTDMVIISIIGDLESTGSGISNNIFEALKGINIRMISYGGSRYNFSFLVSKEDKEKTLQILNDKLFN